jgi:hypothetical protein
MTVIIVDFLQNSGGSNTRVPGSSKNVGHFGSGTQSGKIGGAAGMSSK